MYRVVIADDEVLIRMYIREILENNGYEVVGEAEAGIPDKVSEQRLSFSGESAAGIQPHRKVGAGFAEPEQQAAV